MNHDIILRAIAGIDEELIERAEFSEKAAGIHEFPRSAAPTAAKTAPIKRSSVKRLRFAAAGIAAAACIAFVALGLPAITKTPTTPPNSATESVKPQSVAIKVLAAQAVQAGDWIYYANPAEDYSLYKINPDSGGVMRLCADKNVRVIDIQADWIFYTCETEAMLEFVKIKTDGSNRTGLYQSLNTYLNGFSVEIINDCVYIIDDEPYDAAPGIYSMQIGDVKPAPVKTDFNIGGYAIKDGWIYYIACEEAGNKLFKIKTDGADETFLRDVGEFALWDFIGVYGDRIMRSEGRELYKTGLDGKSNEVVYTFNDIYGGHIIFDLTDDCVYFKEVSKDESGALRDGLFRLNINTGERTFITDDADELLVDGEWVYYAHWGDEGGTLNRIKTDGTQQQKLADGECSGLYSVEDELYYTKDKVFYKINKDGTGEEKVAILNAVLNAN